LEPRFRRIEVLSRLLDQYGDEFPDRADERRKMLARLADSAEDGILPPDLDGVIHTLFYDLLRRGLKPSKQFWKRENSLPKPRKAPTKQANTTSFWKQEISLGRSARPKVEKAPAAPKPEKTSFLKKEISFGRSSKPKQPKPAKERNGTQKSVLRRELRLRKPSLPSLRRGSDTAKIVGLRIGSSQLAAALVNNNG